MERIERGKVPTRQPEKDVIPTREYPKNRQIRYCETTSSAGDVVPNLLVYARSTAGIVSRLNMFGIKGGKCLLYISNIGLVVHGAENDVNCNKQEDKKGRDPCWHCAPAKRLLMAVAKSCWQRDISLDEPMNTTERPFGREPPLVAVFGIPICFALPIMNHCCEASVHNSNEKYNRPVPIKCISINALFVSCEHSTHLGYDTYP